MMNRIHTFLLLLLLLQLVLADESGKKSGIISEEEFLSFEPGDTAVFGNRVDNKIDEVESIQNSSSGKSAASEVPGGKKYSENGKSSVIEYKKVAHPKHGGKLKGRDFRYTYADTNFLYSFNINGNGGLIGNLSFNYECNFNSKNSALVEGFYHLDETDKLYGVSGHYRRYLHFTPKHRRFSAPFVGLFVRHFELTLNPETQMLWFDNQVVVLDEPSVSIDGTTTTIGVNVGRRWLIGKHFNATTRIGYGYPISYYEEVTTLYGGVVEASEVEPNNLIGFDVEVSVGVVFGG